MESAISTWIITFIITAAHGFILGILLLLRRTSPNHLLGALMVSFSLCLSAYILFWLQVLDDYPLMGAMTGLTYTFGPLLYDYIRSRRQVHVFTPEAFLPFAVFLIYYVLVKPANIVFLDFAQVVVQCAQLTIYAALILRFVIKNKGFTNGERRLYIWRRKLAISFAGYVATFLIYYGLVWSGLLRIEYDYMVSLASAGFIFLIGYHGFQQQDVLKQYEGGKYDKSGLSNAASLSILSRLKTFMSEEKPYLDAELKLGDIAQGLELSPHYVSQVINEMLGESFSDFVNKYRVELAKELLQTSDLKIIDIAYRSGFNNKTTFNKAFKKITDESPSEYRTSLSIA